MTEITKKAPLFEEEFQTEAEFDDEATFNEHIEIVKSDKGGKNVYKCKFDGCNQSFSRRFNLKRHILLRHSTVRKYSCTICERKFPLKQYLIDHMQWHSGERKFECDYPGCNKKFFKFGRLNSHRKTHPGYGEWKKKNQICPRKPYELQVEEKKRAAVLSLVNGGCHDHGHDHHHHTTTCGSMFGADNPTLSTIHDHQHQHHHHNAQTERVEEDTVAIMLSYFTLPHFVQGRHLPKPSAIRHETVDSDLNSFSASNVISSQSSSPSTYKISSNYASSMMSSWIQEQPSMMI